MSPLSWLALSLCATALAQVAFKLCFRGNRLWVTAAIPLFLLAPYGNYNALKGLSIATVYVATAVSQLLVVLLSLVVLKERYSRRQYLGLTLVLIGVVVYNL